MDSRRRFGLQRGAVLALYVPFLVLGVAALATFFAPIFMSRCWEGGAPDLCDPSSTTWVVLAALLFLASLFAALVVIAAHRGDSGLGGVGLAAVGVSLLAAVMAVVGINSITVYESLAEAQSARSPPAELTEENFDGADLEGESFAGAILARASFVDARLDGAVLARARLGGADFSGASLKGADFFDANASNANFRGVDAQRANFTGAALRGADLSLADLRGADFTNADLTDANLSRANLLGASLRDARLAGTRLSGADLQDASLRGARTAWPPEGAREALWENTTCPDGTNSDDNDRTCDGHFLEG